jgi:hypothetical protein
LGLFFRVAGVFFIFGLLSASGQKAEENAGAVEIKLTYKKFSQGETFFSRTGSDFVCRTNVPSGNWKLPDFKNRQPLFAVIKLGDSNRLLVLDREPESDAALDDIMGSFIDKLPDNAPFLTRLYFDANGNGDLRDDPVISGKAEQRDGSAVTFAPVDAIISGNGVDLQYRFMLYVASRIESTSSKTSVELQKELYGQYSSLCAYTGEMALEGVKYHLALIDSNCNGIFYNLMKDHVYISRASEFGRRDGLIASGHLIVGAKTYEARMDVSGCKLVLSPPSKPLCSLKLSSRPECMQLIAGKKQGGVALFNPALDVLIPAGRYVLSSYTLERNDKSGNRWIIESNAGGVPGVEVSGDKAAILTFGEPFTSTALVSGSGEAVRMSVRTTGAGQEEVASVMRLANGQLDLPPSRQSPDRVEPFYKILNSRADVIAKGKFEFG